MEKTKTGKQKPAYGMASNVSSPGDTPRPTASRIMGVTNSSSRLAATTNFTAGGRQRKREGRFRSTKGEGHGFGLVRIDAIVERLGGWLSRNSEEGAFTTEILLPVGGGTR